MRAGLLARCVIHVPAAGMLWFGVACTPTTTTKTELSPNGAAAYKIECVHLAACLAEAQRACHGEFHTLSKRENVNDIPESALPGLNSQSQANSERYPMSYGTTVPGGIPPYGPGIESDEPMPIAEVVVACR